MKRLPTTGASIATPRLEESKLKDALRDLGVAEAFDDPAVHELYLRIGEIHGAWLSEQEAKEVSPVAKALRSAAKNLTEASNLLSGHETGFRTHVEFEATSHAARILALDPTVGSLGEAQRLISAFQEEATRIGHACMIAYADLARKASNDGRTAKARMRGDGPQYISVGRSIRYSEAALLQWMKSRQRLSTSQQ